MAFNPFANLGLPQQSALGYGQGMGSYSNMAGVNPAMINPQQLGQTNLSPYMNPYQKSVIDSTMSQLNRQGALAQRDLAGQAQAQGAFGGDRFGVQAGITAGELANTKANTLAQLNMQNYGQAQQGAQFDIGNNMRGQMANQNLQAGQQQQGAQGLMQGSQQGFNMGQQLQQNQMQAGGMIQNQQQQLMDAIKQQYGGFTGAPNTGLQTMISALTGSHNPQTQTGATPSPFASILGAAGSMIRPGK
jgi:hypothetical protein